MTSAVLRDRARTVCTACHDRKVKCDLDERLPGICSNCRRFDHRCVKRINRRQRVRQDLAIQTERDTPTGPASNRSITVEQSSPQSGFIAQHSVLACDGSPDLPAPPSAPWLSPSVRHVVISATGATTLVAPALRSALTDLYFEHLFHHYPVVDPGELSVADPSILLQQAVCLVGNLMRHGAEHMHLSYGLYEKVKTLIFLNYEADPVITLKAVCLMSCWSAQRPDTICMDGPWYWTGVSIRLAVQMGLHRESTYASKPRSGCLRRIFWQLHNADKFQVACWGRPPLLRSVYVDANLPCLSDFDEPGVQARVFIYETRLCDIMGHIAELHLEKQDISIEVLTGIQGALEIWIRELPAELRLYSSSGTRQRFSHPVSDLHIQYFACIILLELLQGEVTAQHNTSLVSLISSSCMARLFEEILLREHTRFLLPLTGFVSMAAALPQIYYRPEDREGATARHEAIEILCSVMEHMRGKYGGADMVLSKIRTLQSAVEQARLPAHDVEASPSAIPHRDYGNLQHPFNLNLKGLFPFPESLSLHLGEARYRGHAYVPRDDLPAGSIAPMSHMWAQWIESDGFEFMDMANMSGMSDVVSAGASLEG
ncbi:fungal-specific transcription factor domain-containing protein [Aspergillus carlsbadensis]|nr:fungal-specific transcription factor domain-containing protein [Aspergillus carlsbadensis]